MQSQRITKIKTKQKEIISMNSLTKKYMEKIITLLRYYLRKNGDLVSLRKKLTKRN